MVPGRGPSPLHRRHRRQMVHITVLVCWNRNTFCSRSKSVSTHWGLSCAGCSVQWGSLLSASCLPVLVLPRAPQLGLAQAASRPPSRQPRDPAVPCSSLSPRVNFVLLHAGSLLCPAQHALSSRGSSPLLPGGQLTSVSPSVLSQPLLSQEKKAGGKMSWCS